MVERRSPKPDVRGSSPLAPVITAYIKKVEFAGSAFFYVLKNHMNS